MRHELKAREWTTKRIICSLIATIFLMAIALLQWPQQRSQAAGRPFTFEEWAAAEDAKMERPLRAITPEEYSDMLIALGDVPAVPSNPEQCEAILEEEAQQANYLALDAGKIETKTR